MQSLGHFGLFLQKSRCKREFGPSGFIDGQILINLYITLLIGGAIDVITDVLKLDLRLLWEAGTESKFR